MASRRVQLGYLLLGLLVAVIGLSFGGPLSDMGVPEGARPDPVDTGPTETVDEEPTETAGEGPTGTVGGEPTATADEASTGTPTNPDLATVTFRGPDGTELGEIQAMVADTAEERYTGLSDTESLDSDEGMVFVYEETGSRTYVMREMDFPLDIIFVGGDGRITQIYHAPVETDDDLTEYAGQAKWVVEVNRGWTTDHGVSVGDRANVTLPD